MISPAVNATEPNVPDPDPGTGSEDLILFGELSIVPDGEDFVVGDPALGVFIGLPQIGVTAIEHLRAGRTVGQTAAILAELTGEEVNLAEFIDGLTDVGLVRSVNGSPAGGQAARPRRWVTGVRTEHVRWLFGWTAWICYGTCAAWTVGVLALLPEYRPSPESILFYPDPAISIGVIALVAIVTASLHEAWHWLAGRAEGVGARFALSRRAFLPVLETDLTQMWALPRRRRYSPLLAGIAFDFLVLAGCLALRVAAEPLGVPPQLDRLLAVVVVVEVFNVALQCMVFLRTDLYLVLSTALGCQDLLAVTRLFLRSRLLPLTRAQHARLDAAHPRDLRAAPWFAVVYLGGMGALAWLLVNLWIPGTAVGGGWVLFGLAHASASRATFWEGLAFAVMLLSQAALPLAVYLRELAARRRAVA